MTPGAVNNPDLPASKIKHNGWIGGRVSGGAGAGVNQARFAAQVLTISFVDMPENVRL